MNIQKVVEKFNSEIMKLDNIKSEFCVSPEKDFTRDRKISFASVIRSILSFGGGTLTSELLKINKFAPDLPTSSAFVQQRDKVSPRAFSTLFSMINKEFDQDLRYHGYRLMAVDGSHIHVPTNPKDQDSFVNWRENERPHNEFHLNAMYDILQKNYTDAIVQKYRTQNEDKALIEMIERSPVSDALVICDRGYESYNNMAHLQTSGWKYIIRVKEPGGRGIADGLQLPECEEFDFPVDLSITRRKNKETIERLKNSNQCRYIPNKVKFDYLSKEYKRGDPTELFTLNFRIVRIEISEGSYEMMVTNLPKEDFQKEELKELYSMRWGIETSFRNLKYIIGMLGFHSRKSDSVMQEIYASLIMYNMTQFISNCVQLHAKENKYDYTIRFSVAATIVKSLFLGDISPLNAEILIRRNVSPVRPNRSYSRKPRAKAQIQFTYRIA